MITVNFARKNFDAKCYAKGMNFLSHAFVARHTDDDLYLLGTSLPDLLPLYDRSLKLAPFVDYLKRGGGNSPLLAGIACHIESDRSFHASQFFRDGQAAIRARLQAVAGLPAKRFFLAHILFEMMLDRYLLIRYPEFGERYYDIFTPALCGDISAMVGHCFGRGDFAPFLAHFASSRFLFHYLDIEGLAVRALRVGAHVQARRTAYDIAEETIKAVAQAMTEIADQFEDSINNYFNSLCLCG